MIAIELHSIEPRKHVAFNFCHTLEKSISHDFICYSISIFSKTIHVGQSRSDILNYSKTNIDPILIRLSTRVPLITFVFLAGKI